MAPANYYSSYTHSSYTDASGSDRSSSAVFACSSVDNALSMYRIATHHLLSARDEAAETPRWLAVQQRWAATMQLLSRYIQSATIHFDGRPTLGQTLFRTSFRSSETGRPVITILLCSLFVFRFIS